MNSSSFWRTLRAVAFCSIAISIPAGSDTTKDATSVQSSAVHPELAPLDGLEPRYKNTRQVAAVPRGLIGWWTGDADTLDSLGQNNGRARGNVTYVPGMVGQAFHLDGKMSYVKVASSDLDPGTGEGLTLDMWIKPEDLSKLQSVAGWAGSAKPGVSLWINAATNGGKAKLGTDLRDTKGGSHRLLSEQPVIERGKWQHILLKYQRATGLVSLYCNGKLVSHKSVGKLDVQTQLDFFIGRHVYINGGNTTFKGAIDEVSITAHALSPAEVQDIFRAGSAGKQLLSDKDTTLPEEQRKTSTDKRLASFSAKHKGHAMSFAIYVDGGDFLHIQGDKLWLVHESWDLPGGNGFHPTRVNGKEWVPNWNDKISDKYTLSTPLPQKGEFMLFLDILNNGGVPAQSDGQFNVRVTQEPTAANDYETGLYLDDFNVGGAHWFAFNLSWESQ